METPTKDLRYIYATMLQHLAQQMVIVLVKFK